MDTQTIENIDPVNKIECEISGCKVRLFFSAKPNEKMEQLILDNLLLVFDRRMQAALSRAQN